MMPTYPQHRNMKGGAGGKNASNLNPPPPPQVSELDMNPSSNLGDLVSSLTMCGVNPILVTILGFCW